LFITTHRGFIMGRKKGDKGDKEQQVVPPQTNNNDDFFSVDAVLNSSSSAEKKSKSKKDVRQIPAHLKTELKLSVAGKRIIKAVEKKCDLATNRIKDFFVKEWAAKFVRTGQLPSSVLYADANTSIDFVPTKRIYIKPETVEMLKSMNVAISDHLEVGEISLDFAALKEHGLVQAAQQALKNIPGMTPEILNRVVKRQLTAKETLYPSLATLAKNSLPAGASESDLIERMVQVTQIVNPVAMLKNPTDTDSLGEAIDFVAQTELLPTPDEEQKLAAKKKWGDD